MAKAGPQEEPGAREVQERLMESAEALTALSKMIVEAMSPLQEVTRQVLDAVKLSTEVTRSVSSLIKPLEESAKAFAQAALPMQEVAKHAAELTKPLAEATARTLADTVHALDLSRDEIVQMLDEEAESRLGLTAAELLSRYRRGELEDVGDVADLLVIARLLPDDDPLFAAA